MVFVALIVAWMASLQAPWVGLRREVDQGEGARDAAGWSTRSTPSRWRSCRRGPSRASSSNVPCVIAAWRSPKSLQTTLFEVAKADGVPAAVAKYRDLRRNAITSR